MTKKQRQQLTKLLLKLKTEITDGCYLIQDDQTLAIDEVLTIIDEMEGHTDGCRCMDCCSIS